MRKRVKGQSSTRLLQDFLSKQSLELESHSKGQSQLREREVKKVPKPKLLQKRKPKESKIRPKKNRHSKRSITRTVSSPSHLKETPIKSMLSIK